MTPSSARPNPVYLLVGAPGVAGRQRPGDVVDVFTGERDARDAFRRLRLEARSPSDWAALVALERAVIRPLCWFGLPPENGRPTPVRREQPKAGPDERTRTGGRRRATRRWALVVTAMTISVGTWAFAGTPDVLLVLKGG